MIKFAPVSAVLVLLSACASGIVGTNPEPAGITVESLSVDGPYSVQSYTTLPDAAEFGDATIYYPSDASRPVGGVAIAPGFTERRQHIDWWGPRLASHGFAVLVLETNDPRERPEARAAALAAAVQLIGEEGARLTSPLFGLIDPRKMALMGHSMGGGGALIAADSLGDQIQAVIPYTPWQPEGDFDRITAPTLVIAGAADRIAPPEEHSWPHFQSVPATTPKVYLEVEGGDHFIADSTRGQDLGTLGRYAIAWLKLHLDDDVRYREFIYGAPADADREKFTRYVADE